MSNRKHSLVLFAALLLGAGCTTSKNWRELLVDKLPIGVVYSDIEFVAVHDGYVASIADSDAGLGTWHSKWRLKQLPLGRPGRFRLSAEIHEDGRAGGWRVRWCIEQQRVKDLGKSIDYVEDDWSDDGQDAERELLFGERLSRRLRVAKTPADRS